MGTAGSEKGGAYAGDDHEAEHSALRHDIHGMYRWPWDAGNKPYLQKNDPKYTAITESQRKMAETGNVILDGRDIGTVVLPHADLKIYQIASVETRAKRRYLENKERGLEADLETIKKEIEQRDYQDMHRAISPLKKADDAIELDTSNMTLEEVVDQVLTLINKTREE